MKRQSSLCLSISKRALFEETEKSVEAESNSKRLEKDNIKLSGISKIKCDLSIQD